MNQAASININEMKYLQISKKPILLLINIESFINKKLLNGKFKIKKVNALILCLTWGGGGGAYKS